MALNRIRALVIGIAVSGCAGVQVDVEARESKYPVSFTPTVPDADGQPLRIGDGLERVGSYRHESTEYGFLYGATHSTLDLSPSLNEQVAKAKGEAVARTTVELSHCAINYFFPLTLLPFWPGCSTVTVTGDVVRKAQAVQPPSEAR
jgi:hypothetical protein